MVGVLDWMSARWMMSSWTGEIILFFEMRWIFLAFDDGRGWAEIANGREKLGVGRPVDTHHVAGFVLVCSFVSLFMLLLFY